MSRPIAIFLGNLNGGGAERVLLNLAEGFSERGRSVDLVIAELRGAYARQIPGGVHTVHLRAGGLSRRISRLRRYLRETRPKVLLTGLPRESVAALTAVALSGVDVPTVVSEHVAFSEFKKILPFHQRALFPRVVRWFYPRAAKIVGVSRGVTEDLALGLGLSAGEMATISNPVVKTEILEKAREEPGHPWCRPGEKPLVLAVGRLTRQKDYPTLLRAFALVRNRRDARLVILGEGEDREKIEREVRRLRIEDATRLLGFVENPFAWMSRARVLVSSSRCEGLPSVLIEAMACGTPVVSTRCPFGPEEILDGGKFGPLVPVGDAVALAAAIERILDEAPSPEFLRSRAMEYSCERSVESYLRLLDSL